MIFLLTGGAACGKSHYAEDICMSLDGPRYYIATMIPYGDGSNEKIEKHRRMRDGKGFVTLERYTDLKYLVIPDKGTVLLECITNLTANEMYDPFGNITDPFDPVIKGVFSLMQKCENLVMITNDVGCDGVRYDKSTISYIRALHRINARLADMADNVYELVCGIPVILKGKLVI